jgi:hypothetical protein
MIVFNNTQNTGTFSLVLRDKLAINDPNNQFKLKLTKLDDFSVAEFSLTDISTSEDYSTFTIDPSSLDQGGYKAEILQEVGATADCIVAVPETVSVQTFFDCDPLEMDAEFIVEAEAVFGPRPGSSIWIGKARIEGSIYNPVYRYNESPTYYVYNE